MNRFIFAFIFLSLMIPLAGAQSGTWFSTDKELSNSLINGIYQDKRNYIWIATENGLNKYDAVKFTTYRNDKRNPGSLKNNYVHTVYEDSRGRFWVGCVNGLLLYDRNSDRFDEVKIYDGNVLLTPDVISITEMKNGEVWVSVLNSGIVRIAQNMDSYQIDKVLSAKLKSKYLVNIYEESNGDIWILTSDRGLNRISKATGKWSSYSAPVGIGSNQISSVAEDGQSNLFVGTLTSGLFVYNRSMDVFQPVSYQNQTAGHILPVKCIYLDTQKRLLVGTDGNGMMQYNTVSRQLEDFKMESNLFDLSKIKVHAILEDKQGNFWVGLFQKGVIFRPNNPNKFISWGYKSFNNNLIGSSCVMSVIRDKENNMWVGTDNDGLYKVSAAGKSTHFRPDINPGSVSGTIMSVFEDSNGDIWLGSYLKGLSKFNKKTGQCQYFNTIPAALGNHFLSNKVFCITEDKNKTLWIGTNGAGVYSLDIKTLTYKNHYTHNPNNSGTILNDQVSSVMVDHQGLIWIGTFRGVSCLNPHSGKVYNDPLLNDSLSGSIVYSLMEDKHKNVWVGTDEGLSYYDRKSKRLTSFTTKDGLPSNFICGTREDNAGNLWVSTHYGISKLNVKEKIFFNYYAADGLQGNEFSKGAHFQSANGELLFGGTGGVTGFQPEDITTNRQKLEIHLIGLDILGVPVKTNQKSGRYTIIDQFISDVDKIKLSHNDNMFSMEFSTFNFGNSERIYYRYLLEGLNAQWLTTLPGTNRISFTNLGYGKYKLRIIACENDNLSEEKQIEIVIFPPWYLTGLAKFIYALLFVLLTYIVYKVLAERIQHKNEMIRREHTEQVNEGKLQFFINISHEIRTPMTLIISPLEKLIKDTSDPARTQAYQLMYRNAQRILRLINQLLDLRKIDKKLMFVKMTETNIVGFTEDVLKTFEYQLEKKNILLRFEHAMPELKAWIDIHNFDKVLVNILSNAFKFTPENGEIGVRLSVGHDSNVQNALRDYFELIITDNGIGIQEDKIERIFERFYQIDNNQNMVSFGTGIGLHLSKNLVELMHGVIFARNRSDVPGSEFIIRLPLGNHHLQESELEMNEAHLSENIIHFTGNQLEFEEEVNRAAVKVKPKTKFKVLIVDDEDEIRTYLKQNLSDNYKVTESENGKQALDLLLKQKFDLVISDVMMPEMDGIELCKKIKSNINIKHIPVVLLTAKTSDEDKAEGYEIGADAYVAKPFNVDLLKKRVAGIIGNRERLELRIADIEENKALIKQVELKSSDQLLLERIIRYINENIDNADFNALMLADCVGLSRVHLHRKMKELTNQSASDYIKTVRLKQAAVLLKSKKLTIAEVGYALGYNDQSHFSAKFKEFYGMTPKEYIYFEPENVT